MFSRCAGGLVRGSAGPCAAGTWQDPAGRLQGDADGARSVKMGEHPCAAAKVVVLLVSLPTPFVLTDALRI